MFSAVIRTPVHFFDVNPIGERKETLMSPERDCLNLFQSHTLFWSVGRILNRFSKDIGQIDSMLPITFVDFYQVRHDLAACPIVTILVSDSLLLFS